MIIIIEYVHQPRYFIAGSILPPLHSHSKKNNKMKRSAVTAFDPTPNLGSSSLLSSPSSDTNQQPTKKQRDVVESDETKEEVPVKMTVGQFYNRMITIPQSVKELVEPTLDDSDVPHYLWSKAEHEKMFEDSDKIKFKILAARGNKHTEAVMTTLRATASLPVVTSRSGVTYTWIKDDIYFKTVADVHNYLVKHAVKVEVKKYELHPWNDKRNRRIVSETGTMVTAKTKEEREKADAEAMPSDDDLWKLYIEAITEKFGIHQNLHKTTALTMAENMLISDSKFLDVLDHLVQVWDAKKGVTKHELGGEDFEVGDGTYLSLMRKEYKLAPDGFCNYFPYDNAPDHDRHGNNSPDSYGVPMMRIGHRQKNSGWDRRDEAWLCKFRSDGNPFFFNPETGHVTMASDGLGRGQVTKVTDGPFAGCVDTGGVCDAPCDSVQREVAITFSQLRTLINKIKGRTVVTSTSDSAPTTTSSSSSSLSSLLT